MRGRYRTDRPGRPPRDGHKQKHTNRQSVARAASRPRPAVRGPPLHEAATTGRGGGSKVFGCATNTKIPPGLGPEPARRAAPLRSTAHRTLQTCRTESVAAQFIFDGGVPRAALVAPLRGRPACTRALPSSASRHALTARQARSSSRPGPTPLPPPHHRPVLLPQAHPSHVLPCLHHPPRAVLHPLSPRRTLPRTCCICLGYPRTTSCLKA